MKAEEYMEYLTESRVDATAIANATMTFMMSRAEMIKCSPVMCLMIMQILTERNLEGHVKMSAKSACRMSKNKLDPAEVERLMGEVIKEVSDYFSANFQTKMEEL